MMAGCKKRMSLQEYGSVAFLIALGYLAANCLSVEEVWAKPPLLAAAPASFNMARINGMAGAVLNQEMSMNRIYNQKLNQELLNPPGGKQPAEPVIQFEGAPPNTIIKPPSSYDRPRYRY
jgi:hypothetical protein